jgi:exodeoxyribonuclease VII large subunit
MELPIKTSETPITVSELSRRIKSLLEYEFQYVFVTGEISNCKKHIPSGNFYFVVKDDKSQISSVMWNSRSIKLGFEPKDGQRVVIKGRISLYETRGTYQIDVFEMYQAGLGELQMAFEALKQKLFEEGLFDEARKKPLPEFPENVVIITSETGAVIEDFKRIANKRFPAAKITLIPATVQGTTTAKNVIKALKFAQNLNYKIDVICIARGGGSIEDLWGFNDEALARAICDCIIPVVSAIGHEIDFTICDFVADIRAATPSAAAEIIFPDKNDYLERIKQSEYLIKKIVSGKISNLGEYLDGLKNNYFFNKPIDILNDYKMKLDDCEDELKNLTLEKFSAIKNDLNYIEKILFNISPQNTLKRGYSLVKKNGKYVSSSDELVLFDRVKIQFKDGENDAEIIS